MKFTPQQYALALANSISETDPKDHDLVLDNFVKILGEQNDTDKYPEIEKELKKLLLEKQGIKQAELTVARPIHVHKQLLDELNAATGNKLEVETKIDENIIGGMVLRVDDTLIDASVKNQLNNLNKELKK
jgi:F-type H+-transporting ATPase subunit delta